MPSQEGGVSSAGLWGIIFGYLFGEKLLAQFVRLSVLLSLVQVARMLGLRLEPATMVGTLQP